MAAAAQFARRYRRLPTEGGAALSTATGALTGELVDLSVGGAAVHVPAVLVPGTPSALQVKDEQARPQATLPCVVRSITPARGVPSWYRVGVSFTNASRKDTIAPMDRIDADEADPAELARTPEGREALFQLALTRLADRQHREARTLLSAALRPDRSNPRYRGLAELISAYEAFDADELDRARIALERARLDDDPLARELDEALRERGHMPQGGSLWRRLRGFVF